MTGGTITGNRTNDVGGGVYLHSGTFNMSGNASIAGNTASNGGGVFVDNYKYDTSAESSDSVFTVDANGKVTGVSKGEAIIFTDAGGYHNECKVTVE